MVGGEEPVGRATLATLGQVAVADASTGVLASPASKLGVARSPPVDGAGDVELRGEASGPSGAQGRARIEAVIEMGRA
jgi:hypothetical protein